MNNINPKVSIITVVFNDVQGIEKTILSILGQKNKEWEYIVIDGNSTDGTVDIIKKYTDKIHYWISEPDKGIYEAMNKGIRKASGKYVMFLNSGDDFADNNTVSEILSSADNYDIVYNDLNIIAKDKSFIKKYPSKLTFKYFTHDAISHPATLIKRELFNKIGFYDESLKIVADWKWFLIALCKYNVKYKHTGIVAANFNFDGISSVDENKAILISERGKVMETEFSLFLNDYKRLQTFDNIVRYFKIPQRVKNMFFNFRR